MSTKQKVDIIILIPTYNEENNISKIIKELFEQKILKQYSFHILILDDSSTDGTKEEVKNLIKINSNISLLEGKKEGLGSAYKRGYLYAFTHFDSSWILQMDADGSHNPKHIRSFINKIQKSDLVIGSRYIQGGETPDSWGKFRHINSSTAGILVKTLLNIGGIKDPTSGYRLYQTNAAKKIDFNLLKSKGYFFQVETLYLMIKQKCTISESPIIFQQRSSGDSKLRMNDIAEFIYLSIKFRFIKSYKNKRKVRE